MEETKAVNYRRVFSELLSQSPPNQSALIYNDLKALIKDDSTGQLAEELDSEFEHHVAQSYHCINESKGKIILCKYNQIADNKYYDPNTQRALLYDPIYQSLTEIPPGDSQQEPGPDESFRRALEQALQSLASQYYPNGVAAVHSLEDDCFHISLISEKNEPSNYWSARWMSAWTYNATDKSLSGCVKVKVHYYESGNAQLCSSKDYKFALEDHGESDQTAAIQEIQRLLKVTGDKFQHSLSLSYDALSESTFKSLRKALPITKNKIDWDKISSYRLLASSSLK